MPSISIGMSSWAISRTGSIPSVIDNSAHFANITLMLFYIWQELNRLKTAITQKYLRFIYESLLLEVISSIPDICDQVRTEKGLMPSFFSMDRILMEEQFKQEQVYISNPVSFDKTLKVKKELTKEQQKKIKSPEEVQKIIEETRDEIISRTNQFICDRLSQNLDNTKIEQTLPFQRQEESSFCELVDKITRKKTSENINAASAKILLNVSLKLNARGSANTTDCSIEDIDSYSLENLKIVLSEISLLYPKMVFVVLSVYSPQGRFYGPAKCVADYLLKETELKIVQETGPFISDLEEKMENNFYEDGSFVMVGNVFQFPAYNDFIIDEFNLKRSLMWSGVKALGKELSKIGNVCIDCDQNGFFEYFPNTGALTVEEKVFGGKIKSVFEFVKRFFVFEKSGKEKQLILGGKFTETKCLFLLNCLSYFSQIKLLGEIGFHFSIWKNKIENNFIEKKQIDFFSKIDKLADEINARIECREFLSVFHSNEENDFEDLKKNGVLFSFHDLAGVKNLKLDSELKIIKTDLENYLITILSATESPSEHLYVIDYASTSDLSALANLDGFGNTLLYFN